MVTCVDTSFLFSLYANDAHSRRALSWLGRAGTGASISSTLLPPSDSKPNGSSRSISGRKISPQPSA